MGLRFSSSSSSTKMEVGVFLDNYYSVRVFQPSDENYVHANELHLQEALFSSLIASTAEVNHHPQLQRNISTCINQEEPEIKAENEPSRRLRYCMICMDEKPSSDIFRGTTNCTHSYCTECTVRYVATKLEENVPMIKCPDVKCTRLLEPYMCRDLIPKDVFVRWDRALCESLILSSEKVYCPFEGCSAMMVVDDDDKVTESECPSCHRLFCAQCKVTWHAGIRCKEFQSFGSKKRSFFFKAISTITNKKNKKKKSSSEEDDALLIQMAKNKQWRRCPSCKFYVEKVAGCMHISCRCGFEFCYSCGSAWGNHKTCRNRRALGPIF